MRHPSIWIGKTWFLLEECFVMIVIIMALYEGTIKQYLIKLLISKSRFMFCIGLVRGLVVENWTIRPQRENEFVQPSAPHG